MIFGLFKALNFTFLGKFPWGISFLENHHVLVPYFQFLQLFVDLQPRSQGFSLGGGNEVGRSSQTGQTATGITRKG